MFRNNIYTILLFGSICAIVTTAGAVVIFSDSFESGDMSATNADGFAWDKNNRTSVVTQDWNNYILQVDEFSNRHPNVPILTVKYEDLCTNLELQETKIHEFLGLRDKWGKVGGSTFHILGNRMRRSFSGEIQQDLSWQTELSEEQIELIESIMKRQLKRYDYI